MDERVLGFVTFWVCIVIILCTHSIVTNEYTCTGGIVIENIGEK